MLSKARLTEVLLGLAQCTEKRFFRSACAVCTPTAAATAGSGAAFLQTRPTVLATPPHDPFPLPTSFQRLNGDQLKPGNEVLTDLKTIRTQRVSERLHFVSVSCDHVL